MKSFEFSFSAGEARQLVVDPTIEVSFDQLIVDPTIEVSFDQLIVDPTIEVSF